MGRLGISKTPFNTSRRQPHQDFRRVWTRFQKHRPVVSVIVAGSGPMTSSSPDIGEDGPAAGTRGSTEPYVEPLSNHARWSALRVCAARDFDSAVVFAAARGGLVSSRAAARCLR